MKENNYNGTCEDNYASVIYFIIAFILTLIIIYIGIYFIFIRKIKSSEGEYCNTSEDCQGSLVCAGGNQCVRKTDSNQGSFGSPCIRNSSCELGYLCINGECGVSFSPDNSFTSIFTPSSANTNTNNSSDSTNGSINNSNNTSSSSLTPSISSNSMSPMASFASILPKSKNIDMYKKTVIKNNKAKNEYIDKIKSRSVHIIANIKYNGEIKRYFLCCNSSDKNNMSKTIYLSCEPKKEDIVKFYYENDIIHATHRNKQYYVAITSNNNMILSDKYKSYIYKKYSFGNTYMLYNSKGKTLSIVPPNLNNNDRINIKVHLGNKYPLSVEDSHLSLPRYP